MATVSFQDLTNAIPVLCKMVRALLSKPSVYGMSLRIEQVQPNTFILHGNYYVSPYTVFAASYSIDQFGNVEKRNLTHVRGGYNWFKLNETLIKQWVAQIRAKKFMAKIKRELIEKAWHPDRVSKWLDTEVCLENL